MQARLDTGVAWWWRNGRPSVVLLLYVTCLCRQPIQLCRRALCKAASDSEIRSIAWGLSQRAQQRRIHSCILLLLVVWSVCSRIFKGGGEMLGCCLDVDGGCCLYEFWDEYAHGPRRARTTIFWFPIRAPVASLSRSPLAFRRCFARWSKHRSYIPTLLSAFGHTFRRCLARSVIHSDMSCIFWHYNLLNDYSIHASPSAANPNVNIFQWTRSSHNRCMISLSVGRKI